MNHPRIFNTLIYLSYIAINSIFILKYGLRTNPILLSLISLVFLGVAILIPWKIQWIQKSFKGHIFKKEYAVAVIILSGFIIIGSKLLTRTTINVDRWAALENTIKAFLSGQYAYEQIDYLGRYSSTMPGLAVLAFPAYALGDIGYFQLYSFVIFAFALYKCFTPSKALMALLTTVLSFSYLYEVVVVSDLISNALLVLSFVMLWNYYFHANAFQKPLWLGVIIGVLSLTRGIFVVPLILFLFQPFLKASKRQKVIFIFGILLVVSLLLYISLRGVQNLDTFLKFNPIIPQTHLAPPLSGILMIALSFITGYYFVRTNHQVYLYSFVILTVLILYSFLHLLVANNSQDIILNNDFDVAYFGLLIPFISLNLVNHKLIK